MGIVMDCGPGNLEISWKPIENHICWSVRHPVWVALRG